MTGSSLTCMEMVELLTSYLEDDLEPSERDRFETHLTVCEGCRDYLDTFRETIARLGRLREEDLSERVRDALLEAFRTWR